MSKERSVGAPYGRKGLELQEREARSLEEMT